MMLWVFGFGWVMGGVGVEPDDDGYLHLFNPF
jgi:hypothetical protein